MESKSPIVKMVLKMICLCIIVLCYLATIESEFSNSTHLISRTSPTHVINRRNVDNITTTRSASLFPPTPTLSHYVCVNENDRPHHATKNATEWYLFFLDYLNITIDDVNFFKPFLDKLDLSRDKKSGRPRGLKYRGEQVVYCVLGKRRVTVSKSKACELAQMRAEFDELRIKQLLAREKKKPKKSTSGTVKINLCGVIVTLGGLRAIIE